MYELEKNDANLYQTGSLIQVQWRQRREGENECGWVGEGAVLAFLEIL
jgi:hypothetical protein